MLDELQLTYTSYNGQNLNSPAVSVIRGSTVLDFTIFLTRVIPHDVQFWSKHAAAVFDWRICVERTIEKIC
jgi:hypothetical protein